MKEFIEKLIERLEKLKNRKVLKADGKPYGRMTQLWRSLGINEAIEIVYQLAEEYEREHIVNLCNQICDKADAILQKDNNDWILCSEPPKKDGFYVVTFDGELCGENFPFVGMCEFEGGEWTEDCVLAWKQQAPYQPKGE